MNKTLREVEFETRAIGPLVLTTLFLRCLGLRETINRLCPVAAQANLDYGLVAELVVQCRLTDPRALYDTPLLCFDRGEATSSRQDRLLLGEQIAKDILRPLPELEALVRI